MENSNLTRLEQLKAEQAEIERKLKKLGIFGDIRIWDAMIHESIQYVQFVVKPNPGYFQFFLKVQLAMNPNFQLILKVQSPVESQFSASERHEVIQFGLKVMKVLNFQFVLKYTIRIGILKQIVSE